MARPQRPVSGNDALTAAAGGKGNASYAAPAAVYRPGRRVNQKTDRYQIAKPWQVEAYRQINICGEARYAASLFAALAGRAEIGVSEPNSLTRKAVWVDSGPEVDAFADIVPTVRERSKLIRDYMLHRVIAGECYLVARRQLDTDPEYAGGISDEDLMSLDALDPNFDPTALPDSTDDTFVWEIVAVTELQKVGETWKLRHDNNNYVELADDEPAIRMWNPDPENRREAWSPFRSLLPTLREIEWLTKHIFTQVRSRLMSAGVWFMPDNITFPPPPPDAVEGGAEAIAMMNEAEQFMLSLAHSSMSLLEEDEVAFPSIVMTDPLALAQVDQKKLIQFWSEIDDKAMTLRSDAVRRFALGMDLPPEQVLGSSGIAVTASAGSAGSSNHWCVDDRTQVFTRSGWVTQDQLSVGDEIYTLNHETGMAQWQPVEDIYRAQVTDEPMTRMKGRDHDSLTTAQHRWPVLRSTSVNGSRTLVKEFRLTSQLTEHDRLITAAPSLEPPSEAKFSDAFVELAAWFWTEGSRGQHNASISQSLDHNPERVARIRAALQAEFPGGWAEHTQASGFNDSTIQVFRLHKDAREALDHIGGKYVEPWFIDSLTQAQLELFIDISAQGDGWHYRQGRLDIWQRDPEALVAYERALILSGRMVSWGEHAGGVFVSDRRGKSTVRPMKIGAGSRSASVTSEEYTGTVWCPVVENSTWLARRNGSVYFTGNSVWANEEQTISSHIEPALDDFVGTLTTAVLRKAVPNTDKVIAYDTATLRLRQDRSKEALEWYDRGILKAEVALRETGFDPESDMMDPQEHKIWLLNRITSGSATPEQVQAALGLLGVALPVALPEPEPVAPRIGDDKLPPSLEDHPYEGPPREDHEHNEAPFNSLAASAEALVLRALEKYGNRLLNNGKRGRDKDRSTPAHRAHEFSASGSGVNGADFDFSLAPTMLAGRSAVEMREITALCAAYCADLVETQAPYSREALIEALGGRS